MKKKKLFAIIMSVLMIACFMPSMAFAEEEVSTPPTLDETNKVWTGITPENVQNLLDGQYGSIDNTTILLKAGTYSKLELGRATKYEGSNTEYYIGSIASENKKTYEEFAQIKNGNEWSASSYYVRNMHDVIIKAEEGADVKINGLGADAGHFYGHVYDYVLEKQYTDGSAYYLAQNWNNITFEGITFTAGVNIESSQAETEIDGVTFENCTFDIENTQADNYALRYYNENNNGKIKNLVVKRCKFNSCYQGVYTQQIKNISVTDSTFTTTGHNAIAIQSGGPEDRPYIVNHGKVVIEGNSFTKIGDRIIRFGNVGADTQITILNNSATESGDDEGNVMKASSLAEGITYDIYSNEWNRDKVNNEPLKDRMAKIGDAKYISISDAINAANTGETVILLTDASDISIPANKTVTIDIAGHTLSGSATVAEGGKLIIKDSAGAGKISFDPSAYLESSSYYASKTGDYWTINRYYYSGGSSSSTTTTTTDNVTNTTEDKKTDTSADPDKTTETAAVATTTATVKAETKTATDGTKTVAATVDTTTADKIVENAISNTSKEVVVNAATAETVTETAAGTATEIELPELTVQALSEKTEASVTIKSDAAEVTLNKAAVDGLAAQAGDDGYVKLVVETVKQEPKIMQVDLKLVTSKGTVSDFRGGNVSVTVKLNDTLATKEVTCVYINDGGIYHKVSGAKSTDGTYTFVTGHFSSYAIMALDEADGVIAEQTAKAKELADKIQLKARSVKTANGNIKVRLKITKGADSFKALEDMGYTLKYQFYRSTEMKKNYKYKFETLGAPYTNTDAKKGTRYYYKARIAVYDTEGNLVTKTDLKKCWYATRIR